MLIFFSLSKKCKIFVTNSYFMYIFSYLHCLLWSGAHTCILKYLGQRYHLLFLQLYFISAQNNFTWRKTTELASKLQYQLISIRWFWKSSWSIWKNVSPSILRAFSVSTPKVLCLLSRSVFLYTASLFYAK